MRLVSGMHRSGTSLVARLLHEAGADFGNPETFYPADRWNPDGYFEQLDVHEINMPLVDGRFGRMAYFHLPSTQRILERSSRFSEKIGATAKKYAACVVKENRFCLTLPAWLEHGAKVEKILVCLRNPTRVARSLRRRNKIPLWLGYRLWQQHNERLLENSSGVPVRYVVHEAIVNEESYIGEVCSALSFMGVPRSPSQVAELCADKIRFSTEPVASEGADLPTAIAELWRSLLRAHASQAVNPLPDRPTVGAVE